MKDENDKKKCELDAVQLGQDCLDNFGRNPYRYICLGFF